MLKPEPPGRVDEQVPTRRADYCQPSLSPWREQITRRLPTVQPILAAASGCSPAKTRAIVPPKECATRTCGPVRQPPSASRRARRPRFEDWSAVVLLTHLPGQYRPDPLPHETGRSL